MRKPILTVIEMTIFLQQLCPCVSHALHPPGCSSACRLEDRSFHIPSRWDRRPTPARSRRSWGCCCHFHSAPDDPGRGLETPPKPQKIDTVFSRAKLMESEKNALLIFF